MERSSSAGLWLLDAMFMCIAIEGAIYAYVRFIRHPFRTSAIANVVSFFAGFFIAVPCALALDALGPRVPWGMYLLLGLVVPTLASIGVEGLVVSSRTKPETPHRLRRAWVVATVANVLTNGILGVYLYVAMQKASVIPKLMP